jgi:hypothetical protein
MGLWEMEYLTTRVHMDRVCNNDYSMTSTREIRSPTCCWWLYLFGSHGVLYSESLVSDVVGIIGLLIIWHYLAVIILVLAGFLR